MRDLMHRWPAWTRDALACPACLSSLRAAPGELVCAAGAHRYPQTDDALLDLRHGGLADSEWSTRQAWMEREYSELLDDGDHAAVGFENDFGGIAEVLAGYHGRVLDIGGGTGIARHWLPAETEYVLLEPSLAWRDPRWMRFAERFPCLTRPCAHVRAYAEHLPFAANSFDGALSLWSLNHVGSPSHALSEAVRVLRPGGRLLVVLEDAEPTWADIRAGAYPGPISRQSVAVAKLLKPVRGWRVQRDHVYVPERALRRVPGARPVRREWLGLYLTVELEKK